MKASASLLAAAAVAKAAAKAPKHTHTHTHARTQSDLERPATDHMPAMPKLASARYTRSAFPAGFGVTTERQMQKTTLRRSDTWELRWLMEHARGF